MAINSNMIRIISCLVFMKLCFIAECYPEDHRIPRLPGQPPVTFQQYSGHITLDEATQRKFFYYLAEAQTDPRSKPLVIWLAGGPGCPILPLVFTANGPYRVKHIGRGLVYNDYSYNKEANMLYLDTPAASGLSIVANNTLQYSLDDTIISEDNFLFLQRWLEKFPEYIGRDLYIGGHSYAGHYNAALARLIVEKKTLRLNLKGVLAFSPLLHFKHDFGATPEYLWSHGMISDSTYEFVKKSSCNFTNYYREYGVEINLGDKNEPMSPDCEAVFRAIHGQFEEEKLLFMYMITQDVCNTQDMLKLTVEQVANLDEATKTSCMGWFEASYLLREDALAALHVSNYTVPQCSKAIYGNYSKESFRKSMLPTYEFLLRSGVRVLIASGDQDGIVPFISTRTLVDKMAKDSGLETNIAYSPWYFREQLGGWRQIYGGGKLAYATVKNGGHTFDRQRPEPAFVLFQGFLNSNYTYPKALDLKS